MAHFNDYLYPLNEAQVRLHYDGESFCLDGMPDGQEAVNLPEVYRRGRSDIFTMLESMAPCLSCISVTGVWFHQQEQNPFVAYAIWLQQESEGFYLPMSSSASLFRENGIPYFHKPSI